MGGNFTTCASDLRVIRPVADDRPDIKILGPDPS